MSLHPISRVPLREARLHAGETSSELPRVHYTELQLDNSGRPTAEAWNTYCREIGRLLAEGHEGKFALIKDRLIVSLHDTLDDGYREGREKFLLQPFLVQPICEWQPYLRVRGVNYPCPTRLLK